MIERKIKIVRNFSDGGTFEGEEYEIDLSKKNYDHYFNGCIRCRATPFFGLPFAIILDICPNGKIEVCQWEIDSNYSDSNIAGTYLYPDFITLHDYDNGRIQATDAQRETVAGLVSDRIRVDGLHLAPSATLQRICPVDIDAEEKRYGRNIVIAKKGVAA